MTVRVSVYTITYNSRKNKVLNVPPIHNRMYSMLRELIKLLEISRVKQKVIFKFTQHKTIAVKRQKNPADCDCLQYWNIHDIGAAALWDGTVGRVPSNFTERRDQVHLVLSNFCD